ncbi:MAG: putative toxin-antitoxin system toxin component, PIN family [Pseudanabaena sp. M110S1SP2A07QC]|nr:putative toxin-antitoxin system toxin component, PIN family [Pseudanabaena sp. M110S1SP2A07QC]
MPSFGFYVLSKAYSAIAFRYPKDDKFLELAVNGKADYLITGDKDLLVLHPFRDIEIINPSDFLNISN